jgi:hypothetical protein
MSVEMLVYPVVAVGERGGRRCMVSLMKDTSIAIVHVKWTLGSNGIAAHANSPFI